MIKVPKWVYAAMAILAVVAVAAQVSLVGQVTWLLKGGNGDHLIDFWIKLSVLLGFGTAVKEGVTIVSETMSVTSTKPAEPPPLPPPPGSAA